VDGAELVAVCDLVEDRAAAYGTEFDVPYFTNYHTMMREVPDIDLVAVVTPSGMHAEHALDLLRRYGPHLIVEKPTFMRPSQLHDTFVLADERGVRVFPVFQNRYNHAVERVRQALRSGELGAPRVVAVRVRWCRPQRYYDMAPWRGTFAQDGGALTNQGIHHVDLMRHLGGEVREVHADMRTMGAQIEVEDTVVATVAFDAGHVGLLEVTTAARPHDFEASISFVCENGLAQIGGIAVNELQVFTPDPTACAEHSEDFAGNVYGHGHEMMYRDIVADLRGDKAYPVSRDDCLRTLELLHSFYRSDEERCSVRVGGRESDRLGRRDDALADLYRTALPA
jgi:predicted dehydrogenase